MEALFYLLLGLIQGLTEFLPVSSSGHLTLGQSLLGLHEEDLTFTVLVHAATAFSTVVVTARHLGVRDVFTSGESGAKARSYAGLLLLSAVPAAVLGLGFKDAIEAGHPQVCGSHALCDGLGAAALATRQRGVVLGAVRALGIGLAQACAILPEFPALGPPSGPL